MIFAVSLLYGNYSNVTSIPQLFDAAGDVFPLWWPLVLLATFIISFFALKEFETMRAMPAAALLTTIIAAIFYSLDWIANYYLYACMVGLAISLLALMMSKEYN